MAGRKFGHPRIGKLKLKLELSPREREAHNILLERLVLKELSSSTITCHYVPFPRLTVVVVSGLQNCP